MMHYALTLAKEAAARGEVPVGAVITNRHGTIITSATNEVESTRDATAHAEILAIRKACQILGQKRLTGHYLYVTLEPCAMCAHAISMARLDRVYFGAYDPKSGGVEHGAEIFRAKNCHHRPEIYGGIEEQTCAQELRRFFQLRR